MFCFALFDLLSIIFFHNVAFMGYTIQNKCAFDGDLVYTNILSYECLVLKVVFNIARDMRHFEFYIL